MTDTPETPAARRRRLRWISFAELIGVLALVISAASYWDAHQDRARVEAPATPAPLLLTATRSDDRTALTLKPAHGDAVIQTQTLIFPPDIHPDPVDVTSGARIEAAQIEHGIRRFVPKAKVNAPPRLPVGIVTIFIEGNATRRDAAIYDVGYRMRGRLLAPFAIDLEGITLVRRVPPGALKAAVATRWDAAIK